MAIDGLIDTKDISQVFTSKLSSTLNLHCLCAFNPSKLCLTVKSLADMKVHPERVLLALDHLKPGKKDHTSLDSRHFISLLQFWLNPYQISLLRFYIMVFFLTS